MTKAEKKFIEDYLSNLNRYENSMGKNMVRYDDVIGMLKEIYKKHIIRIVDIHNRD